MEDLNEGTCVQHCLENENYNKTLITLSAHRLNTAESYAQQYIDYSLEPYKTIARLFLSSAATSSTLLPLMIIDIYVMRGATALSHIKRPLIQQEGSFKNLR